MSLFGNIEEKFIQAMKGRYQIVTEIVDKDEEFKLVSKSYFDGHLIDTHELDLEPLVKGISKRL